MKLAASSAAFRSLFADGGATHLEWLEWCAQTPDLDGVVFAASDFPRDDAEYLAQIKKIATDVGLSIVAVDGGALLHEDADEAECNSALALATLLGAPYLLVSTGGVGAVPPASFAATVRAGKRAASLAKRANITLAVRSVPGTVAGDPDALAYFVNHVDSAWLRVAAAPLRDGPILPGPRARTVIAYAALNEQSDPNELAERLTAYRGWLIVDATGPDPREQLRVTSRGLRRAFASTLLTPTA